MKTTPAKLARIIANIQADKELMRQINREKHTTPETFATHCLRYVAAVREGRAFVNIESVSSSGMSRVMAFYEMAPIGYKTNDGRKFHLHNFHQFFRILGHTPAKNSNGFRISGCGMDMVFATNYKIIRTMERLGIVAAIEGANLAQRTPSYV